MEIFMIPSVSGKNNNSAVVVQNNFNDTSDFKKLPSELLKSILVFNDLSGILSMRQVSHRWKAILETPSFWNDVAMLLREPSITNMQELKNYTTEVQQRTHIHTFYKGYGRTLHDTLVNLKVSCPLNELSLLKKFVDDMDAISFCTIGLQGKSINQLLFKNFEDVHSERSKVAEWCEANQNELSECQTLIFQDFKLTTFPEEIKHLKNLEEITCFCNSLTFPSHLDSLTQLKKINLSCNSLKFSAKKFNELKSQLSSLTKLTSLDLSNNNISESQVSELKQLFENTQMDLNVKGQNIS